MRRDGQDVHLTPIEYDLLRILARNRGRLLTHRTLLSEVWGPQYADDTQALRTHIANLRRKLEPGGRAALHPHRRARRLPLHRLICRPDRPPRGVLHTIHTARRAIHTRSRRPRGGCCGARMAERRLQGLQRVLGVNALFATAYGNVGSSIYYALGLVAGLALGLTPLVFVITGIFFFCTAATYAEATAMFPEAGGSSSFARHAFNEFVSFFAAWAQMLNYVITVAISAFFVPHYLGGLFWEPLRSAPGDVIFGAGVIVALSLVNVVGIKESAGLNIVLALVDFATQVLMVVGGALLVFSPQTLADNIHLGVAPTWTDFLLAIPLGMIAYTGIETISNMAEEAKDEAVTIPKAIARVRTAVYAIYFTLPVVALSALPVDPRPATGEYSTLLGVPEEDGGFAGDPILGVVKQLDLGFLQQPGELYVGLLAATILLIATNAGIIGVSRLVYSMGIHRQVPDRLRQLHPKFNTPWIGILVFGVIACLTLLPGQADVPGQHVRLRRDAVVHDRARGGHPHAPDRARSRAPLPRPRDAADRRPRAARLRASSAASRRRCRSSS